MRKSSLNSRGFTRKTRITIVTLCVVCLFGGAIHAQVDVVQQFEQIATFIRENRIAEAEKELASVLRVAPDLPVALNLMGTIRAKQGRLNEAESLFLRAVRNDR